jgi:aryl-alcohol dehydrogenase-like predicted oxidoreductase
MKLAMGTVQFGLPYGIANISGQIDKKTVSKLLYRAKEVGIDTLDTAISYGESEQCLGENGVEGWRIITKLPKVPNSCDNVIAWVEDQVSNSLARLNVTRLGGLLLHQPNQLLELNGKFIWSALQKIKENGIVEKIGFSIYKPEELDLLWPYFQPDLVQAPYNIVDRRLKTSGWLQKMTDLGVETHVRSVFLQGLLLMGENKRPKKFNRWARFWAEWDKWLYENGLTAQQACLGLVMTESNINKVVIGVDSLFQLEEILSNINTNIIQFPEMSTNDVNLIDPSRWGRL